MDPAWLARNIRTSWRYRDAFPDFIKRLLWIYSNNLPPEIGSPQWLIGFNYPKVTGRIRLLLRSNAGSDSFIHGEVFEHQYYDLGLTFAPKTILDLGANIGLTCIYFARCFPEAAIACVEPMPSNLTVLRRNLELNGVNATVFPGAIDAGDGHLFMEVEHMDYGHRVADLARAPANNKVEVTAYSIPTLVRRLGWERIGLLKVDIEGHEKVLLSGDAGWAHLVDAMCVECHEGFGERDLEDFARRFGFRPPKRLPGIWLLER